MKKQKLACYVVVPLLAAPLLAGCGGSSGDSGKSSGGGKSHGGGSSSSYGKSGSSSYGKSGSAKGGSAGLKTASSKYGKIIVDGKGMTAYYFDKDKPGSGKSVCKGECAAEWPAIDAAGGKPKTTGITGKVTTVKSGDGGKQLAVNGRPVYTFADDAKPGDVKGQGDDGVWYVVSPSGHEMKSKAK